MNLKDFAKLGTGPFEVVLERMRGGDAVMFEGLDLMRLQATFMLMAQKNLHRMQVRRNDLTLSDPIFDFSGPVGQGPFDLAIRAHGASSREIVLTGLGQSEVMMALDKFHANKHRQMVIERNDEPKPEKLIKDTKERSDYDFVQGSREGGSSGILQA